MKKVLLSMLVLVSVSAFAQDVVKNGTIYKEHPYITAVKNLNAAFAKGDTTTAIGYYADSARFFDAPSMGKPYTLAQARAGWQGLYANWDVQSIKQVGYPDGLAYDSDPFTVQSWWEITAVNKKTGKKAVFEQVVFDTFNKDGKISSELSYYDTTAIMDAMKP